MIFSRLFILSLMTFASSTTLASTNLAPSAGDWGVHGSLASSYYQYEEDDVRSELPVSIIQLLDANDIGGDDTDLANYSVGMVYYFTPRLNFSGTFTEGIEVAVFDDLFDSTKFDVDLQMIEFDLSYRVAELTRSLGVFVKAGVVLNRIQAEVYEFEAQRTEPLASASENKVGAKVGVGLQWDFPGNWSMKFGYSHYTFMSIDKSYLQFEYRF